MEEARADLYASFRAKYFKTPDRKLKNTSTTHRNSSGSGSGSGRSRRRSRNLSSSASPNNNKNNLEEEELEKGPEELEEKKKYTEEDDGISLETIRRKLYTSSSSFSSPSSSRSNNSSFYGSPVFASSSSHHNSSIFTADELQLKDEVMQRIKDNFHLETQALRTRIKDATEETSKARDKIHFFQQELAQMKSKCHELTEIIHEKDQTIASIYEKQTLAFPTLMYDTIRRIEQIKEDQQEEQEEQDEEVEAINNRSSNSLMQQQEMDSKLYEMECQMTQLYQELKESKQKNDMLNECLTVEKQHNKKLKKACQYAKEEILQLTNQLTNQHALSKDFQNKMIFLEQIQEQNQMLQEEIDLLNENRCSLHCQMDLLQHEKNQMQEIVYTREEEILSLQDQLLENQVRMEHLQSDLLVQSDTRVQKRTIEFLEQKIEQLSIEKSKFEQNYLQQLEELKNYQKQSEQVVPVPALSEEAPTINRSTTEGQQQEQISEDTSRLKYLFEDANVLSKQLDHLKELIKNLIQTENSGGMFDLELLLQCTYEDREVVANRQQHKSRHHTLPVEQQQELAETMDFYIEHLQKALGDSTMCLDELQSLVEESLPRLIGNNCALQ